MGAETTEGVVLENRLSVREAAASAGVHEVTIRKWMKRKILPYTKTKSGSVRIKEDDLKEVLGLD